MVIFISGYHNFSFRCSLQVQPKHVKEAFRLLNKSIIRVETPDVNLEQEDELEEEEEQQQEEGKDKSSYRAAHQSSSSSTSAFVNFTSTSLSFDPETDVSVTHAYSVS